MSTIEINGYSFIIPQIVIEHSSVLTRYLSKDWDGKRTPLTLDDQFFEVNNDDIRQALNFISVNLFKIETKNACTAAERKYYSVATKVINNLYNLPETHSSPDEYFETVFRLYVIIDNINVCKMIIDYLGLEILFCRLNRFVELNIKNIEPYLIFMYDRKMCTRCLYLGDLDQLLNFGFPFELIMGHMSDDILLNIHECGKFLKNKPLQDLKFLENKPLQHKPLEDLKFLENKPLQDKPLQDLKILGDLKILTKYDTLLSTIIGDLLASAPNNPSEKDYPTPSCQDTQDIQLDSTLSLSLQEKYSTKKIEPLNIDGRMFNYIVEADNSDFIILNKEESVKRLEKFTEGMLTGITWDNIVIAGGCLSLILYSHLTNWEDYPSADIDLFVWGEDVESRKATINRFLDELRQTLDIVVFQRGKVITLVVRNHTRNIQIIDCYQQSLSEIIYDFDFTTSMIVYDGKDFLCTTNYLFSFRTKQCYNMLKKFSKSRIMKNVIRGFSVLLENEIIINDESTEEEIIYARNKYLFATNEPVERLLVFMKSLFGKDYKLVTGKIEELGNRDWKKDYDPKISILGNDVTNIPLFLESRGFFLDGPCTNINISYVRNFFEERISIRLRGVTLFHSRLIFEPHKCRFSLGIMLNKDQEDALLPCREILSSIRHVNTNGKELLDIYKKSNIIYPYIKFTKVANKQIDTHCYRGRRLLTIENIEALTSRHCLLGDITISPYVISQGGAQHKYIQGGMIRFRLDSFVFTKKIPRFNIIQS